MDNLASVDIQNLLNGRSWQDKYKIILAWGQLIDIKPALRLDEHRLKACSTPFWVGLHQGQVWIDGDSRIMCGLGALLVTLWPLDVHEADALLHELGLQHHLTQSRSNGFMVLKEALWRLKQGLPLV